MIQIVRNIQIDLIMDIPNPIIDTFNGIWNSLSVIEVDVYHSNGGEFVFYDIENKWIFFLDNKDEFFWCKEDRYWDIMMSKFNLDYLCVQSITKLLVEKALNINITTSPNLPQPNWGSLIEDQLDKKLQQIGKDLTVSVR